MAGGSTGYNLGVRPDCGVSAVTAGLPHCLGPVREDRGPRASADEQGDLDPTTAVKMTHRSRHPARWAEAFSGRPVEEASSQGPVECNPTVMWHLREEQASGTGRSGTCGWGAPSGTQCEGCQPHFTD